MISPLFFLKYLDQGRAVVFFLIFGRALQGAARGNLYHKESVATGFGWLQWG